jgi:hypothetical protein
MRESGVNVVLQRRRDGRIQPRWRSASHSQPFATPTAPRLAARHLHNSTPHTVCSHAGGSHAWGAELRASGKPRAGLPLPSQPASRRAPVPCSAPHAQALHARRRQAGRGARPASPCGTLGWLWCEDQRKEGLPTHYAAPRLSPQTQRIATCPLHAAPLAGDVRPVRRAWLSAWLWPLPALCLLRRRRRRLRTRRCCLTSMCVLFQGCEGARLARLARCAAV